MNLPLSHSMLQTLTRCTYVNKTWNSMDFLERYNCVVEFNRRHLITNSFKQLKNQQPHTISSNNYNKVEFSNCQLLLMLIFLLLSILQDYMCLEGNLNDILKLITFASLKIITILWYPWIIWSPHNAKYLKTKNSFPLPLRYWNVAQYLKNIESEAFQVHSDLVFILKMPLIEQKNFTLHFTYISPRFKMIEPGFTAYYRL